MKAMWVSVLSALIYILIGLALWLICAVFVSILYYGAVGEQWTDVAASLTGLLLAAFLCGLWFLRKRLKV